MTARERFLRTLRFESVDRMPMLEWAMWWDKTLERWSGEGLKFDMIKGLNVDESLRVHFGLDLLMQLWTPFTGENTPKPKQNGAPIINCMDDYEKILPTLFGDELLDEGRLKSMAEYQKTGQAVTWITLDGFFWGPRTLLGIENHLYDFYDDPEIIHRIAHDIAQYDLRVLNRVFKYLTPDFITFAEDMSYNLGSMISEEQFDEFIYPYYRMVVPTLREKGVRVFVDSDGDVTKMISWFERAGVEGILPLERQAGVDVERLRREHPNFLFIGHFDKMVMPYGEKAMRREFERLLPVMKKGGFISGVDHQTPPSVSLDNYKTYLRLYREYALRAMSE